MGVALVSLRFVVRVRMIVLVVRSCSTKRCLILLHEKVREIPTVIHNNVNRERKILEVTISCLQSWWDFVSHLSLISVQNTLIVCSSFPY